MRKLEKNIDFDTVAKYYDTYVPFDYDIAFWMNEVGTREGVVLELMCGTGRISIPLIKQGVSFYGIDYSDGLLKEFGKKLKAQNLHAELICTDARIFHLDKKFDSIFIGCHSLSEILTNEDKGLLLDSVQKHLSDDGFFVFSLYNPETRLQELKSSSTYSNRFDLMEKGLSLSFNFEVESIDKVTNIVRANQKLQVLDSEKNVVDNVRMNIAFHLITKSEIDDLLDTAGFRTSRIFGDYDGKDFHPKSLYMIYRCQKK